MRSACGAAGFFMPSLIEDIRTALSSPAKEPLFVGDPNFPLRTKNPVSAAVLVPIIRQPRPHVLLTTRASHLRNHAGQVAFPGGRVDPGDKDEVAAALREAHEEVGLEANQVEIIGAQHPYHTGTGFFVHPIVGVIPDGLSYKITPEEVANVFEAPLDILMDPDNYSQHEIMYQGAKRRYYSIDWDGHHIWGATAGMLLNLAASLS